MHRQRRLKSESRPPQKLRAVIALGDSCLKKHLDCMWLEAFALRYSRCVRQIMGLSKHHMQMLRWDSLGTGAQWQSRASY
mmetsp:Transcript_12363/g.31951  ORF Transcript_12363/g.31951 Transcript_12363/m.31951 type:complete len:80 (+) Transcript_12363:118-357(+)